MFQFPDGTWLFLCNMASKTRQTNFSEQGKLLLAELGRDFLEVESKCYISEGEKDGKKSKDPH